MTGPRTTANPVPVATRLTTEGDIWLVTTLILVALGWFKGLDVALVISVMMAGLLIVNRFVARRQLRGIVVDRPLVPPLLAGEIVPVRTTVKNTSARFATLSIPGPVVSSRPWLCYRMAPGSEASNWPRVSFPTRGRYSLSPLQITSAYPYGLYRAKRVEQPEREIVVLPAPGIADPDGLRQWALRWATGGGSQRPLLRRVTADPADIRGVRPYRPGDSMRSVHWRTSARRGALMVREYDSAPVPDLVLVIEPWLPAHPDVADRDNLETALSLVAAVVLAWCRSARMGVTVIVAGRPVVVRTGPPTEAFAREALVPLADLAGGTVFDPIPADVFGRHRGGTVGVVVSSRPSAQLAADLTRASGIRFIPIDPSSLPHWYQPPR